MTDGLDALTAERARLLFKVATVRWLDGRRWEAAYSAAHDRLIAARHRAGQVGSMRLKRKYRR